MNYTPEEVRDSLALAYPERSVCIARHIWKMRHLVTGHEVFWISILPGFDGTECQQFGGSPEMSTLHECFIALTDYADAAGALQMEGVK